MCLGFKPACTKCPAGITLFRPNYFVAAIVLKKTVANKYVKDISVYVSPVDSSKQREQKLASPMLFESSVS